MWWKEVIQAFRHQDVVCEMEKKVGDMLDAGQWMFEQVSKVLTRRAAAEEIAGPLHERDHQINRLEQEIRETIVTHLSLGNDGDLGPCLVLMSVVKDAERIGDYCKNIFEVGKFYRGSFTRREYHEPLQEIQTVIHDTFQPTKEAFLNGDDESAKSIVQRMDGVGKRCDLIIQQLLSVESTDLCAAEAAAYVLLARHYKRVRSHLSNIATSVAAPVPLLDFQGKLS
jgi:phosphate transport system protein